MTLGDEEAEAVGVTETEGCCLALADVAGLPAAAGVMVSWPLVTDSVLAFLGGCTKLPSGFFILGRPGCLPAAAPAVAPAAPPSLSELLLAAAAAGFCFL